MVGKGAKKAVKTAMWLGFLAMAGLLTWRVCLLADAATALVATSTRVVAAVPARIDALSNAAEAHVIVAQAEASYQLDQVRRLLDTRSAEALRIVDARALQVATDADSRTGEALATVASLRTDLAPSIASLNAASKSLADGSEILFRRDALPAQLLGLTGAAKVTLGEAATTMRGIQRATPEMILTVRAIGDNIEQASAASIDASRNSALLTGNLAKATKPLPAWVRIPLSITGAVAPTVAGAIGAAAATGAFR